MYVLWLLPGSMLAAMYYASRVGVGYGCTTIVITGYRSLTVSLCQDSVFSITVC